MGRATRLWLVLLAVLRAPVAALFPAAVLAGVAQVRQLPVDALAGVALDDPLSFVDPRTRPATPARSDPVARAPAPPAGNLGVKPIGVSVQIFGQGSGLAHQPRMAGEQIDLVARPVGMVRDGIGVGGDGAPEVGHKAVGVVEGFHAVGARGWVGRTQQHGGAACEGLHVVVYRAKGLPHGGARAAFAAKVGERGGQGSGCGFHALAVGWGSMG